MESLLFVLNGIAVVLLIFMGIKDDRRRPGAKQISIFRYRDTIENPSPPQYSPKDPVR